MGKILILDGDSIAYRCAAAAEDRFIKVTHQPSGQIKIFKHRTAFKESMRERNKEITADYLITDDREVEPLPYVLSTIKKHIDRIEEEVQPDKTIIFAGEQFNFRLDLPLPSRYKGNRTNTIRPLHLMDAKKYLQYKYNAKEAIGKEVDDEACIAAYDAIKAGHEAIMYFYEKDQYQLDGVTLLYDNDTFKYQKVPLLGELRLEKTSIKGLGLKFLAYQWVCSDPVDNYCAYDLSKVKFGPKSAYNLLVDCKTEQDILVAVRNQFKSFYPDTFEYTTWDGKQTEGDWYSMMQMYYSCARMMRSSDDTLDCRELFNAYGVEI